MKRRINVKNRKLERAILARKKRYQLPMRFYINLAFTYKKFRYTRFTPKSTRRIFLKNKGYI